MTESIIERVRVNWPGSAEFLDELVPNLLGIALHSDKLTVRTVERLTMALEYLDDTLHGETPRLVSDFHLNNEEPLYRVLHLEARGLSTYLQVRLCQAVTMATLIPGDDLRRDLLRAFDVFIDLLGIDADAVEPTRSDVEAVVDAAFGGCSREEPDLINPYSKR